MSTETITSVTASFTRPSDTTQYAAGDLVADNTTAGSVHPLQFPITASSFELQRVNLSLTSTSTSNATFRIHLYLDSPTVSNGDNGVWATSTSRYIDAIDVDTSIKAYTDGKIGVGYDSSSSNKVPIQIVLSPSSMTFYGLIEAKASYTPTATETLTVTLTGKTYT